ncbi:MAG: hypothetical protein WCJ81_01130 [bacterium]
MNIHQSAAVSPQSPYKKLSLKSYHIKYYGLIVVFFMMIASVKVYVNYATIQSSIAEIKHETADMERHTQYISLQTYAYALPKAAQFIAHDNSVLYEGERVFMLVNAPVVATGTTVALTGEKALYSKQVLMAPWYSWIVYFGTKMNK